MKKDTMILIAIVLGLIILSSSTMKNMDLSFLNPSNWFGGAGSTSGLVDVNKPLDLALINKYAGSSLNSKTLKVYDEDGETLLETLTTDSSDGTVSTAFTYPSGKTVYVYYESSNDKMWWKFTVPQMRKADAEASSVNAVRLEAFSIGTYTTDALYFLGTAINDGGTYNKTASGNTPTFTYRLANTGSDNTGLMTSYDPIYKMNLNVAIYITFSTGNYQTVVVHGFSYDFTLGTIHYVGSYLDAYKLTKHLVGNTYKSNGVQEFQWSLDLTGYSGDTTVMQINVYAYTDIDYCKNHGGSYGPEAVIIAEQTVTLQD